MLDAPFVCPQPIRVLFAVPNPPGQGTQPTSDVGRLPSGGVDE
jgi:hypothetical protein